MQFLNLRCNLKDLQVYLKEKHDFDCDLKLFRNLVQKERILQIKTIYLSLYPCVDFHTRVTRVFSRLRIFYTGHTGEISKLAEHGSHGSHG